MGTSSAIIDAVLGEKECTKVSIKTCATDLYNVEGKVGLRVIAAKLIYYVFDIVCHIARRYKAISSHSKEDMVWRPQLPRNNASSC